MCGRLPDGGFERGDFLVDLRFLDAQAAQFIIQRLQSLAHGIDRVEPALEIQWFAILRGRVALCEALHHGLAGFGGIEAIGQPVAGLAFGLEACLKFGIGFRLRDSHAEIDAANQQPAVPLASTRSEAGSAVIGRSGKRISWLPAGISIARLRVTTAASG